MNAPLKKEILPADTTVLVKDLLNADKVPSDYLKKLLHDKCITISGQPKPLVLERYGPVSAADGTYLVGSVSGRAGNSYIRPGDYSVLVLVALDEHYKTVYLYLGAQASITIHGQEISPFASGSFRRHLADCNKRLLVGADPEVFALSGSGELLPAFAFLPAKSEAGPYDPYWDGYQAEFNTKPESCQAYMMDHIRVGLARTLSAARKLDRNASLSVGTVMDIPAERLRMDNPIHVNFGCTPSLNAYGKAPRLPDGSKVGIRSSGGHIHLTLPFPDKQSKSDRVNSCATVVKEMDRILGVLSVSMFERYDDPRRRKYYGRAGEFRMPPYGIEYRVLSSAWMIHPAVAHFIVEIARRFTGVTTNGPFPEWDVTEEEAIKCINESDVALARSLLKRNEVRLDTLLKSLPGSKAAEFWKSVVMDGLHMHMRNPDKFSDFWRLGDDGWMNHSGGNMCTLTSVEANYKLGMKL